MKRMQWLAIVGLAAVGCQTPGSAAPEKEFVAEGSVSYLQRSASFSPDRVVAPMSNINRRGDGSWAGRLQDAVIDADQHGNSLKGVDLILSWEETPTGVTITGSLQGRLHRFEVNDQYVLVTGGSQVGSFKLLRHDRENFGTGNFHFIGRAADLHPPEPQFALMMLAAFD